MDEKNWQAERLSRQNRWRREDQRARCINRFIERQRAKRWWISFFDISHFHGVSAGPAGSSTYNETREFALWQLSQGVINGDFERNAPNRTGHRWSRILYLAAEAPRHWLDRAAYCRALEAAAHPAGAERRSNPMREPYLVTHDGHALPLDVLGCCFLPRTVARQWIESNGSRWPAEFHLNNRMPAPVRLIEMSPPLRPAQDFKIHEAITAIYDLTEAAGTKPPNVNEVIKPVQQRLAEAGYEASGSRIRNLAGEPQHKGRRRTPGRTLASETRKQEC